MGIWALARLHSCQPLCQESFIGHMLSGVSALMRGDYLQHGPGTETEPETGTVGTVFLKPEEEPEPSEPYFRNRNRNRPCLLKQSTKTETEPKTQPLEPSHAGTVTKPNRTVATQ